MEVIDKPVTAESVKSPFQLFSAFTEMDKDKFFGRNGETALLFQAVQEANVILLYGESGTGKTSIVQCGLLNETKHFNWTSITIRRGEDINASFVKELKSRIEEGLIKDKAPGVNALLEEVFLNNFQPILLIFDQFEEIFVFGNENERKILSDTISGMSELRIPWKMVFVIREDFLAQLDVFEKELPGLFKKRLRIELMDKSNCREVIIKSFDVFNIGITPVRMNENGKTDTVYNAAKPDTADKIIDTVTDSQDRIHLPYFQVFLDKLWKEARIANPEHICIDQELVTRVGNMGDVLKGFLEEKVTEQNILGKVDTWKLLKLFVPEKGTTRKKVKLSGYTAIPEEKLLAIVSYFVDYKILSGCSENNYELGHESLVPVIQNVKLNEIRPRLISPTIEGNPYQGLASFNVEDDHKFYGRKDAVNTLYSKISEQVFLVIAGNSGSGKSSLIKAGLFPLLEKEGYHILTAVRAGDKPLQSIKESLSEGINAGFGKFILLVDQYEELITRINERETREAVYDLIFKLLEEQKNKEQSYILKIIITVRADFEPQFRIAPPLNRYWSDGKYIVPPFTREEIREVIEEPAYQAGLEFSPPSLVETIAEEVYSSQTTGLLPLMSYTLKVLYDKYEESGRKDNLLLESDYNDLGGVIGGLQKRAEQIYTQFKETQPSNYNSYQSMMQNILLRMIYLSTGELAGQRVLEDDLVYNNDDANKIKNEVLKELLDSELIVTGRNSKECIYYEPAHDVLVRSWNQVWDWIGQVGKDNLFLRSRLTQAVDDYNSSNRKAKLLWNNDPRLDDLVPQTRAKNTWLNKKEFEFVTDSVKKRQDAIELIEKEREEKVQLIEDKYKEQKEKTLIIEEKVAAQKQTIRRVRMFRTVILVALICAAILGGLAFSQWKVANKNFEKAEVQGIDIKALNTSLGSQYDLLKIAKDSLGIVNDSIVTLAESEKLSALMAKKSAIYANNQRLITVQSVKILTTEIGARKAAQMLAESRRDSLRATISDLSKVQDSLKKINDSLFETITALKVQTKQNATQLVSISKNLEKTDIVMAYRVAELAKNRNPSDTAAIVQYQQLMSLQTYFYIHQFKGDFSSISPDGKYFLITSSADQSIQLRENNSYKIIDSVKAGDGLLSVSFSPSSELVMETYKNKVEISSLPRLSDKKKNSISANNISIAKFAPDESHIFIVTDNQLQVWPAYSAKAPAFKIDVKNSEKIVSAFFSDDSRRIISGSVNGTINIWDAANGKQIRYQAPAESILNSYISSKGNCFMITTPNEIKLYDSWGGKIRTPSLQKYGQLLSAVFSEDGRKLLLSFNSVATRLSQQQQQQQQQLQAFPKKGKKETGSKSVILIDLDNASSNPDDITDIIGQDDISLFTGYANIAIEKKFLFLVLEQGLVKVIDLDKRVKGILAGHKMPVNTISVYNGYIATSAKDNTTKIWQYNTAQGLEDLQLLLELSAAERKELGITDKPSYR